MVEMYFNDFYLKYMDSIGIKFQPIIRVVRFKIARCFFFSFLFFFLGGGVADSPTN